MVVDAATVVGWTARALAGRRSRGKGWVERQEVGRKARTDSWYDGGDRDRGLKRDCWKLRGCGVVRMHRERREGLGLGGEGEKDHTRWDMGGGLDGTR